MLSNFRHQAGQCTAFAQDLEKPRGHRLGQGLCALPLTVQQLLQPGPELHALVPLDQRLVVRFAVAQVARAQLQLDVGNADAAVDYFGQLADREDGLFPREEALMAKARA